MNDGYCDNISSFLDDGPNVLVFQTDHIQSINLQQVVVNQKTIPSNRGVNRNSHNLTISDLKPNQSNRILKEINKNQSFLLLSTLCRVSALSKGLSLTAITMLFSEAFLRISWILSDE